MLLSTPRAPATDRERLLRAVVRARGAWDDYAPHVDYFRRRIQRSKPVPPAEVPPDVVTMNSRVALRDEATGEVTVCTLVYPEHAAPGEGRVSVLSPLGIALYGARVGEEICWMAAGEPRAARVKMLLYQPEAAGHHHL
jgi:regulator of nucleoside diphosphate kinase